MVKPSDVPQPGYRKEEEKNERGEISQDFVIGPNRTISYKNNIAGYFLNFN